MIRMTFNDGEKSCLLTALERMRGEWSDLVIDTMQEKVEREL